MAYHPWKMDKERRRQEKIDRMASDIMVVEARKLIEEVYRKVFEENVSNDNHKATDNGEGETIYANNNNVSGSQKRNAVDYETVGDNNVEDSEHGNDSNKEVEGLRPMEATPSFRKILEKP